MKLRKRIISVITVFTLLASLLPTVITVSAQGNNDLFIEDFESYATGPITVTNNKAYDYEGNQMSISNVVISGSDYLEIAEENGNKFLKVHTARNSSNSGSTRVRFEFGSGYSSGKKEFSYKYKSIAHYSAFRMFGQLFYQVNDNNKTIQALASQTTRIIKGKVNQTLFGYVDDLGSANYSSGFGTVTQTVDFDSDTDNYKIVVQHDNATRNTTMTKTISDSIKGIVWNFNNSLSGGNGTETAIDGFAVYAFDDVKVKDITLELVSSNVANNGVIPLDKPFTMTFSESVSAAFVTLSKNGVAMENGDYTVTVSNETVSVMPQDGWEDSAVYTVNVGTVTAVSGSPAFSGTTFTLTGSNCLFKEDFEGYSVGVIATGPVTALDTTLNRGDLNYKLLDGDKLEIVEKDGSKVLKLTVGNTSTDQLGAGRLILDFDQNYGSGKAYEVGFDYYVENHSRYFGEFGSLYDDNNNAAKIHSVYYSPLKWTGTYRNNLQFDGKSESDKKIADDAIKSSDAYWKHQSTSIDFSQSPKPLTVSATKASDGTLIGSKSVTISTTRGGETADVISGIAWGFSKDYGSNKWYGQDEGDGVYYFDNITVKRVELELTSVNVPDNGKISASNPFTMTFSSDVETALVTLSKDGDEMDNSDYTVTVSGDTVSVVPVDGWYNGSTYTVNVGTVTAVGRDPFKGSTYTLIGNSDLFSENFEGYETGVIATGEADTVSTTRNPGRLSYKLIEGDKLEIVEKDGSKVLKLTAVKGDTTARRVILDFDQHYGDGKAYDISFDYYVENNSVWFSDFGSVCDDKISGQSAYVHSAYFNPIKVISSYQNNLYFDRSSAENKFYASGLLASGDDIWKNQNMTIDFSQDPRPFTITTTNTSSGEQIAKKTLTVSQTYGKQTADNISSIAWDFSSNSESTSWDGKDPGSGVYYIDNIKVTPAKLSLDSSNVVSDDIISIYTDINLKFNAAVPADVAEYITITKDDEPLFDDEYSVSLSADGKTVKVSAVGGWDYDSRYILGINSIETSAFEPFEGTFIEFYTEEYDNTIPPNIVSSTIANGAENVDYRTGSVILSTNGVRLDETTITKQNIKLYKDGEQISSYSVAPYGNYAVEVSFDGLQKDTSYTVTVSGLMSRGANALAMTKNYALDFVAVGDIYVTNVALSRTEVNNTFNFSATIHNNTDNAQSYQPIVMVKNKTDGKLVALKLAANGTLEAGGSADISIPGINADLDNVDCKLLIWKNISGLEPVMGKRNIKRVKIGTTVIFANNSNFVVADGVATEEETSVSKNSSGFVIPQELASKYLGINSSLTEAELAQEGIGYYVSDKYDFIAVGDDIVFDTAAEENAIKKFGIYVSPTGDDSNSGYSSEPVKTLAKAVKIYESGNKQPILVHGGTYRLDEAIVLKSNTKDGGISIKDFGDGEVILTGAVELPSSEFTAVTDTNVRNKIPSAARSSVKQISLANYIDGGMSTYKEYTTQQVSDAYYELFSGDTAQTIARWPNTGFSTIGSVSGNSFTVSTSGKASLWNSADSGIIAGYFKNNWAFEDIYIDTSSGGSSTIALNKAPKYGLEAGQRFYAMNMLEELDAVGEYYIDNEAKILYYYPTSSFGSVNPEISTMGKTAITDSYSKNCLMYIMGVNKVKISGITFEKTRGSGIVTNGGSNISIDGCTFGNIGHTAVELGSSNSEVINSHIYSIGGNGIRAEAGSNTSLTPGNIRIADNTIHNFGRIFRTYQGAIHLSGCGNTAEYNTIYDAPHCAVRFTGSNHNIKHNIIHDVVQETSDSGAIYSGRDWTSWGTTISSNYFYNIKNKVGDGYTNQAIYIDDLLCGTTVSNNVIKDSDCAALFGGGRGNTFRKNTVVNCNIGLKYDNRGENTSASQLVRGQTSSGEDTILETFVKFLEKESVIATMTERGNFIGFTKLVNDVNSSDAKLAYPKSAVIKENKFYGSKVNNSGYIDVDTHVINYANETYQEGTKSTSVPSYDLPDCGARN